MELPHLHANLTAPGDDPLFIRNVILPRADPYHSQRGHDALLDVYKRQEQRRAQPADCVQRPARTVSPSVPRRAAQQVQNPRWQSILAVLATV